MGAMIASDKLFEPFSTGTNMFAHGSTFGGHPVAAAVAMKNLDIMENEKINEHVRENEGLFRKTLEKLYDLPIVGNVRGEGFFYGIELVKNQETKESFSTEESEKILRGFISQALFEHGIYCRTDDRGDPVIQLAPALIANRTQFDEIETIIRTVLTKSLKLV
jgi:adenosylmethionine-8-amino-7-oxononanoate aminotransferase